MKSFWSIGVLTVLLLPLSPAKADDVITNIMSPIVSYQYPDTFSSEALTKGGIMSPIASYQYLEWPGNGILGLQSSPTASYYYQFLDAPVLNIVSTTRTPTTAESTPAYVTSPPSQSQLVAYHAGIFTPNLASIDPSQPTVVLTHGWIVLNPVTGTPLYATYGVGDWPTTMAPLIHSLPINANIVAWDWHGAASSSLTDPAHAGQQTREEGVQLGNALRTALGSMYSGRIQFIGHSFGTLVNAYAANYLQGANWNGEPVSPTPWPSANMLMTLFDEAEVGADKNFALHSQDLDELLSVNANLLVASPYYHPLPKHYAWAENYISAFGILQPGAANVILTKGFPWSAPNPLSWFLDVASFHGYPQTWYEKTVQYDISSMGFLWPAYWLIGDAAFANAPSIGTVYVQEDPNSDWKLASTTWQDGTTIANLRIQEYRTGLSISANNAVPAFVKAYGTVKGDIVEGIEGFSSSFILSLSTTTAANDPCYSWSEIFVPSNAVSMAFDYRIQGDWASDALAVAIGGTNVLSIPGSAIQTNDTFSSGALDVSAFVGQTNELFIGIVGTTSTNAQVTLENLTFSVASAPSLQVQATGDNSIISWPMSAQNCSLQTTTNLGDPNSWATLTNVPVIVNFQNAITNPMSGSQGFYRLMQSHQ
jgi:hypothetical protein